MNIAWNYRCSIIVNNSLKNIDDYPFLGIIGANIGMEIKFLYHCRHANFNKCESSWRWDHQCVFDFVRLKKITRKFLFIEIYQTHSGTFPRYYNWEGDSTSTREQIGTFEQVFHLIGYLNSFNYTRHWYKYASRISKIVGSSNNLKIL